MRCGTATLALVLIATPGLAAPERIQQAIDRGIASLKQQQAANGMWNRWGIGGTSLAGLTLLECDVPARDPAIQRAAAAVRPAIIGNNHTYTLATTIMFLDRLGDPADTPLIQALGVRLLGGQNASGGWSYSCPPPSPDERKRLETLVAQRKPVTPTPQGQRPPLDPEVQKQLALVHPARTDRQPFVGPGDNSNTQFAVIGLWAARRHGLPIDDALKLLETRFRNSQNPDGGWGYMPGLGGQAGMPSSGSMTCAGLIGLAFGHGNVNEAVLRTRPVGAGDLQRLLPRDPARDPAIRNGLAALGTAIGQPIATQRLSRGYYFLWSVERVAVAFSLNTIGKKDWYGWGSQILLSTQSPDGSWNGEHGPEVDTCFAVLFLRRANLARDLTASLRGIQDPGEVTLRAGGVGGEELLKKGLVGDLATGGRTGDRFALTRPSAEMNAEQLQAEAVRLAYELARTPEAERPAAVEKLKQGKGLAYTQALAAAIPQLQGAAMQAIRDALAERLTRMTAATLRTKLESTDPEIRRAAALACAMKEDRNHVPDLIALLDDREDRVSRAAHAGLKYLTGEDHGSDSAAWKTWWEKQARP